MKWISATLLVMVLLVSAVKLLIPVWSLEASDASPETILVLAAASTTDAISEISRQFTKDSGIHVRTSFASSASLSRQIVNGADADVFLSADTKWVDDLAAKGLVADKQNLLGNRLVIIVPNDSKLTLTQLENLVSDKISHIAMGEPESVPAGKYAKQAFEKLGLWEKLKPKIASAEDVRNALTFVETGAAEVGVVYATDAAISKKVKVIANISEILCGPIRYPIVLLKHGNDTPAAVSFYQYLSSPKSLKVFQKYDFTTFTESNMKDKPGK